MKKWILVAALIGVVLYQGLNKIETDAYQAQAVRCAEMPDHPGCDDYATAAGNP